jgi:hypothetical protein
LIPSRGVTVALVEERIVGVMAVSTRDSLSFIDQLYIEPGFCGRGIGTQLIQTALTTLARPIRLYTFEQNRSARRFYERHGFRAISFSDGRDNEERCPDVLYELRDDTLLQEAPDLRERNEELEESAQFAEVAHDRYICDRALSAGQYRALLGTFSDVLALSEQSREGFLDCIERLIRRRFSGEIVRRDVYDLWRARTAPRTVRSASRPRFSPE